MGKDLEVTGDRGLETPQGERGEKRLVKERRVARFYEQYQVILFKGQHLIRLGEKWEVLGKGLFDRVFYELFGGLSVGTLNDVYSMVLALAEDATHLERYVALGDYVWDTRLCGWVEDGSLSPQDCVFRSPVTPDAEYQHLAEAYVLALADGRSEVAGDIWQTLAPLLTLRKPTGVVWYKGRGRNGKSGLLDRDEGVLFRLFPEALTTVTLAQIEDERDTPRLNGMLANVVDESSDGMVQDSRTYKAIGTHQSFFVHKFHSQDMLKVDGNLHHIFSTNNMPIFSDKSDGAKRRTIIIGFDRQFAVDETFYERTFTPEFLSGFMARLVQEARAMKKRRYIYEFSLATRELKQEYDLNVNTAESFGVWLVRDMGVQYFVSFTKLRLLYEWWCDRQGFVALGKTHLRNAMLEAGFERSTAKVPRLRAEQSVRGDGMPNYGVFADESEQVFRIKGATLDPLEVESLWDGVFRRKVWQPDMTPDPQVNERLSNDW